MIHPTFEEWFHDPATCSHLPAYAFTDKSTIALSEAAWHARDAEIAAIKADRYSSCDCCHETRTCVLVETGFGGEHELLCSICLSRERHQAEDEITDLKRQLTERDRGYRDFMGLLLGKEYTETGSQDLRAALDAHVQEKVDLAVLEESEAWNSRIDNDMTYTSAEWAKQRLAANRAKVEP